jgi:putative endonuclease
MGYLYILQSQKNKRYYIGSTNDLERRLAEHNSGKTKSLRYLLPVTLVYSKNYPTLLDARAIERKLKSYKSRTILERIVSEGEIIMGL